MSTAFNFVAVCAIYCLAQINLATTSDDILQIKDIDTLFELGDRNVDLRGQKNAVLIVGGTGAGKSTLSKFLRQDPSLTIILNEADDYVFADGEVKIGNEDNHRSKTLFPQVDTDQQSGSLLADCAGFEDTRHPMYDLLASFFTQKVFNTASQLKIVMVESFERMRLSSDRTAFMRSVKQLAVLLQDNVASFSGSIGLVATKADSTKSDEQLEKSVNVFLKATVKSLQTKLDEAKERNEGPSEVQALERQILLVQFLAEDGKVAIFRRPNEMQSPWTLPPLRTNFNKIRHLIFNNLRFLDTSNKRFQVSVASETVVYIQNKLFPTAEVKLQRIMSEIGNTLTQQLNNEIESQKITYLKEDLIETRNYVTSYEAKMAKVISTDSLLDFFRQSNIEASKVQTVDLEMRKFEFLCSIVGSDIIIFRNKVKAMYGNWAHIQTNVEANRKFFVAATSLEEKSGRYEIYANPPFTSTVTSGNYVAFITYIVSLNLDSPNFLAASSIIPTAKQILILNRIKAEKMNYAYVTQRNDHITKYSGNYILASQIQSPENIRGHLVINAGQKFFVDRDLTLIDTHLTILAPILEVIGTNKIFTLKGNSENGFATAAAPGTRGLDGKSGSSSGEAKIYALDVVNAHLLTIRSIGGDGSGGQAGGHGANGVTSIPPVFTSLEGEEGTIFSAISSSQYVLTTWNTLSSGSTGRRDLFKGSKQVEIELVVSNEQGRQAPTSGGDGGHGGAAAPPGIVQVTLKNAATRIATESVIGKSGVGGLGGTAGQDSAMCSFAKFNCHGHKKIKKLFGFKRKSSPFNYNCQLERKDSCDAKFPSALNGNNGITPPILALPSHKIPVMRSVEKEVQDFCEIAAASAVLQKGGQVNEFLDFVFTLPGANCKMQNGVCMKKS